MEGRNTLTLCFAEARRLLEIALHQEQYVRGEFRLVDIHVDRIPNSGGVEALVLTLEGKKDSG